VSHSLKDSVSIATDNLLYEFGPFLLAPHARQLSRNGELVSLAAPEFELLLLLVRNPGRVVEKIEIMQAVWPDVEVEENNLTVRMSSLRRALGETRGHHPYIQTVPGRGYCLITQVKELSAQANTATINSQPVPELPVEKTTSTGSTVGRRSRRFGLYALLLVALLSAAVIYAVLWWQRSAESQVSVQTMKISRVTYTGRAQSAALSPDAKTIAYVERDGELNSLWLQRVGTNTPLQLLPPAKLLYRDPAFSPDGNTLYYSKCEPTCRLHKMPVLGGVQTALPIRADCPVVFSPDGKKMAYAHVGLLPGRGIIPRLLVANPDGTGEEELHARSDANAYQGSIPAWSPDGKTIALPISTTENGKRFVKVIGIGVADRKESTLISQPWRRIADIAWSTDGSSLIVVGVAQSSSPENDGQLWRVPLNGGEPHRITNDLNNYRNLGVSTDGRTLMAVQLHWTSDLWIAPADNPAAGVPVTRGTIDRHDGDFGVAITPDNRLIFVSNLSGRRDLWSVNDDGSGLRQLTDVLHSDSNPVVTPDGRYIVFESRRDGAHSIWRVDVDGRHPMRLTHGSYDTNAVCSPDGKWVFYEADAERGPKLRKVSIDGGEPIPLTEDFAQRPTISPDGKTIAYHRIDEKRKRWVVFMPAQGGAPVKLMPVPKNFGNVMHWTPAGDAIAYRESATGGIWKMPIDGTPPSEVLNTRGGRVHYFRYSHDGRRLVYASGPTISDVILITKFN
jgi:Tol biopolymer transport system component/DNA-binding winged helix-turn-helix (wHTH) protein